MTRRREFTAAIKRAAWRRAKGKCERCGARLSDGNCEYHHELECTFGGSDILDNCVVLCRTCHRYLTSARAAVISKSNRQRDRGHGIKRPQRGQPMPGSKASGWKKTFRYGTVRR